MQPDAKVSENLRRAFRLVAEAPQRAADAFNDWAREVALRAHRPTNVNTAEDPLAWCLTCNTEWPCDEHVRLWGEGEGVDAEHG